MSDEENQATRLQRELVREYQLQLERSAQAVIATPEGRLVLWHVIQDLAGTFAQTETGEERSSLMKAGARAVGLALQKELQDWAPAEFVHLLGENMTRGLENVARLKGTK